MSEIPALLLFLLPLAYSPGPGNMVFAATGARFGLRATLPASVGYHLATWGVTVLIGMGMGRALLSDPVLLRAVQLCGAAYVLWLAFRMARAGAIRSSDSACVMGVGDGALLLLLNPKAYMIIALMFTQFLQGGDWVEVAVIASVFTLNNLVSFTLWSAAGDGLARLFRDPARARVMNLGLALPLAAVAIWMTLS